MNKNLDKIEAHLRYLFEDRLFLIFKGEGHPGSLIEDLVGVMEENILKNEDGQTFAPDHFILSVPAPDLIKWQIHQDILDEMAIVIYTTGQVEGFIFRQAPIIQLKAAHQGHSLGIMAHISPENSLLPDTDAMTQEEQQEIQDSLPEEAFLIVAGTTNFHLTEPVINIGRHSENELLLNDPHVSRHHAQLRAINKRYVIFDLGSIGGTHINGKPITQANLFNGDVIRLGMTNLIYVQTNRSTNPTTTLPTDDDLLNDQGSPQ